MKTRLVWIGLVASLGATGAVAATQQHFATASTKKEAKRLATAEARFTAQTSARCFHPARQVNRCEKVEGGFRCKAESSADYGTCNRAGWVYDPGPRNASVAWADRRWETDSWPANPWSSNIEHSGLYGQTTRRVSGPPLPTPFPDN